MKVKIHILAVLAGVLLPAAIRANPQAAPSGAAAGDWVEPMKKVHARFKGETGTFAHFGDSITISMAFWASLSWDRKNMDAGTQAAYDLVNAYMKKACWREWKGPKFGNTGMMTIRWAHENVDTWLKDLNPEAALIMFGTNDLGPLKVDEYEAKTREVVAKCLAGGTVVILSTIPPKHGRDEKCKVFVEAVRRVARDMKVPLCDYYQAVMDRRPDDWDGRLEKFKGVPGDTYEVPTLISRDGTHPSNPKKWQGDYSEEGLKNNGFVLRNYVVLHAYADLVRKVLKP